MPVPDFQSLMLPLLEFSADGKEHSLRETIEALADILRITNEEQRELLPSGQQSTFNNRVGWSRTYLKKAGLLESSVKKGNLRITDRGLQILTDKPPKITIAFLRQFPEFVEFQSGVKIGGESNEVESAITTKTPEEEIELAYQKMRRGLTEEVLETVKSCSAGFFEQLVVDLLLAMGYGGTKKDAGQAIGKTGDGGIDGIIKEDRLGLDIVYIQAKRWDTVVSRPEIQKFAGALIGQKAKKGVFITTSSFTQGALEYASIIENKIVLIDGETLAQLMIDYNIGVTGVRVYELKRIDSDYFTED